MKSAYPEVFDYLKSIGVDMEMPFETSPSEPDGDGLPEYGTCQYIVLGNCPDDYHHQIGDVEFSRGIFYPDTKIEEEHFVLDVYPIRLRYEPDFDEV